MPARRLTVMLAELSAVRDFLSRVTQEEDPTVTANFKYNGTSIRASISPECITKIMQRREAELLREINGDRAQALCVEQGFRRH